MEAEQERLGQQVTDLMGRMLAKPATSPAGTAAKILMAYEWADMRTEDCVRDFPHCLFIDALRDLLPHAPADLAAAMRIFTDVDKGSSVQIGWCLDRLAGIAEDGGAS